MFNVMFCPAITITVWKDLTSTTRSILSQSIVGVSMSISGQATENIMIPGVIKRKSGYALCVIRTNSKS